MDPVSLLWGNLFCLDLYRSLEQFKAIYKLEDSSQKDEHLDIRLDAFGLKVGREGIFVPCWQPQLHFSHCYNIGFYSVLTFDRSKKNSFTAQMVFHVCISSEM